MQIPSLREISNQIRKVKSNLHGLEKLRVAVREVNKHRRALSLFIGEGNELLLYEKMGVPGKCPAHMRAWTVAEDETLIAMYPTATFRK